jgi:hypothetical protein
METEKSYPILCVLVARVGPPPEFRMSYCWEPYREVKSDISAYIVNNATELGDRPYEAS